MGSDPRPQHDSQAFCMFAAAKIKYGTILANVDWLHGSAESFLTITNLFIGEQMTPLQGTKVQTQIMRCRAVMQKTSRQGSQ